MCPAPALRAFVDAQDLVLESRARRQLALCLARLGRAAVGDLVNSPCRQVIDVRLRPAPRATRWARDAGGAFAGSFFASDFLDAARAPSPFFFAGVMRPRS